MLFSSDELAPKLTQLPAAEIERYRDMIPLCVLEIRKLLGANFTARITTKAAPANQYAYNQEKSGKTDLCSCGSGKQYKKCCGLN